MKDDAGGVDHVGRDRELRIAELLESIDDSVGEIALPRRCRPGGQPLPLLGEDRTDEIDQRVTLGDLDQLGRQDRQQPIDARRSRAVGGRHRSSACWRERMGVEPTTPRGAQRHRF